MGDVPPGYRLHRLEVYNWGTFDSSRGAVHTVRTEGATTLLIGQNGCGKSTLVDALLTLFVRTGVRNYNVAAGAQKQERDERSYIKGAFDRRSRDEDNRAEVLYLRPDGRHYSALLAVFKNDRNEAISLALVLYLNADGGSEKIYCLAHGEKSIAKDLSGLVGLERAKKELQSRGFKATDKYTEYHGWLTREFHIRPKAMDMFNQTVAVKDIQSLNKFIREHMLEATPWGDRLDSLQAHFTQLTEAHQTLVRVRKQFELLEPIEKKAESYRTQGDALSRAERLLEASTTYFRQRTVEILEPAISAFNVTLEDIATRRAGLDKDFEAALEEERTVKNDIANAGGERLREIPLLIKSHRTECDARRDRFRLYEEAQKRAGLPARVTDEQTFQALQAALPEHLKRAARDVEALTAERDTLVVERANAANRLAEDKRELEALGIRQTKLPESQAEIRRVICENLRLKEQDLPYAAELITVPPEEKEWESSIEMVLRGFALSLLVPQRLYAVVSSHVNGTRIRDQRGHGQKLVYLKVGERVGNHPRPVNQAQSLFKKIRFNDSNSLAPWVKAEIEHRFNYQCCDTMEEFQACHDRALTRERHVKMGTDRHEKDDRERIADPRFYVLGWDNKEKRRHLQAEVERVSKVLLSFDSKTDNLTSRLGVLHAQRAALSDLERTKDFSALDFDAKERDIIALEKERDELEESNAALRALKKALKTIENTKAALQAARDQTIRDEDRVRKSLDTATRDIGNARRVLAEIKRAGVYEKHSSHFDELDKSFAEAPLTVENLVLQEAVFKDTQRNEIARLKAALDPLLKDLYRLMANYLREFPADRDELEPSVEYLESFCALCQQIRDDDLPRHEARFKDRLNEKVLQEIGLLNGAFQTEKTEIEQKIDLLNQSLRQLPYREGTFMRLEPRQVHDPDILAFQGDLRECLSGSFEGTAEANEARYLHIERVLSKLRDDASWRQKVTDIRRWFDFAAREIDESTGKERSYYQDSAGQSGGEKAKLAFTILVAAIAYQYDIDPQHPVSDRLHFVVVDEMFSKVDDKYAEYALQLFRKFGLQLLIVAPLDAKARVTEPYVECYLHVVKDPETSHSEIFTMTAREFEEAILVRTRATASRQVTTTPS